MSLLIKCPARDACLYLGERVGPPALPAPLASAFSIAYSSATTGQILFKFSTCMGKISEYGVRTFQPIREVT